MDRNMIVAIAVMLVALSGATIYVVSEDQGTDAASTATFNWSVGVRVSDVDMGYGDSYTGSVPGVTFSITIKYGGTQVVVANGTPTTAGTYTVRVYDGTTLVTTCNVTVTGTQTYTITLVASPSAGGYFPRNPGTSFEVEAGSTYRASGSGLTVGSISTYAISNSGYSFSHWSSTSGTINSNKTFTAYFSEDPPSPTYYTVSFTKFPSSGGTLSQSSVSVTYGTTFSASGNVMTVGSSTITATPAQGYDFLRWSRTSGTITSSTSITAYFQQTPSPTTFAWNVDEGIGTVDLGSGVRYTGSVPGVTISYTVKYGGEDWIQATGTPTTIGTYTVNVYQEASDVNPTVVCEITVGYASYTVTFTKFPSDGGTVSQSSVSVESGTTFSTSGNVLTIGSRTITATPAEGYEFLRWAWVGGVTGTTITGNATFTADFQLIPVPQVFTWNVDEDIGTVDLGSGVRYTGSVPGVTITYTVKYGGEDWIQATGTPTTAGTYTIDIYQDAGDVNPTVVCTIYVVSGDERVFQWTQGVNIGNVDLGSGVRYTGSVPGVTITYTVKYGGEDWIQATGTPTTVGTYVVNIYQNASDTEPSVVCNINVVAGDVCTITLVASPADGGYFSLNPGTTFTVASGSSFLPSGSTLTIGNITTTAFPNRGYEFVNWSWEGGTTGMTITGDTTFTAQFDTRDIPDVWWSNGYANNKITVVLDFEQTTGNLTHKMYIPLIQYNGSITEPIDGRPKYFELTGDTLEIECAYNSNVKVTIGNYTTSYSPGIWQRYALVIDSQTSKVTFQGISSSMSNPTSEFNFMSYTPVTNVVIADWSAVTTDKAMYRIYHEDTGTGSNHVRFQANATATFLDTYGFVMIDPRINIGDYFPDYDNIRLNLYSFALYGDTITFNNKTYAMDGSQITIRYEEVYEDGKHYVATPTGSKSFTTTLTNVYITWENLHSTVVSERQCYLTFVDDRMTFEMGTYALGDLWVSGVGMWYFTTAVWSPYTAYEKDFTMDWNSPFNISADGFILIFIAIAVIALVAMNVIWKPTFLDYAVVVGGCIISYMMLGFIW